MYHSYHVYGVPEQKSIICNINVIIYGFICDNFGTFPKYLILFHVNFFGNMPGTAFWQFFFELGTYNEIGKWRPKTVLNCIITHHPKLH